LYYLTTLYKHLILFQLLINDSQQMRIYERVKGVRIREKMKFGFTSAAPTVPNNSSSPFQ